MYKKSILKLSVFSSTEIDLKEAQRFFAQKFSCGASVTGEDEIIIQGDFTDDIIDVIQEKWPEVISPDVRSLVVHKSQRLPHGFDKGFHLWQHRWLCKTKPPVGAFPPGND